MCIFNKLGEKSFKIILGFDPSNFPSKSNILICESQRNFETSAYIWLVVKYKNTTSPVYFYTKLNASF